MFISAVISINLFRWFVGEGEDYVVYNPLANLLQMLKHSEMCIGTAESKMFDSRIFIFQYEFKNT